MGLNFDVTIQYWEWGGHRTQRKSVAPPVRRYAKHLGLTLFTRATLASAGITVAGVVSPSVTSRCSTETITQTTPHDSPAGLYFSAAENPGKTQIGSPPSSPTEAPNAGGIG